MAVAAGTDDTEVPRMEGISPMDQATVLYLKAASMFAALTDGRAAEAGSAEVRQTQGCVIGPRG